MSLCQFEPPRRRVPAELRAGLRTRQLCVWTTSPLRENTVTDTVSQGCRESEHHGSRTREMDFQQLCIALRSFEIQAGDSRIADAQLIWHLRRRGPSTTEELIKALALSDSSISRTTNRLGAKHRKGTPGYGLITSRRDPRELRRFLFELTDEAKQMLSS